MPEGRKKRRRPPPPPATGREEEKEAIASFSAASLSECREE
jgi:hypothetical protein